MKSPEQNAQNRKPRTGKPRTGKPRTGKPRTGKPRTGKPRTGKPRTGKPRTGKPRTGKTRTKYPEQIPKMWKNSGTDRGTDRDPTSQPRLSSQKYTHRLPDQKYIQTFSKAFRTNVQVLKPI
ncbi:hypothetical protein [Methanosarcina sp. KYL-1]|uniref:hypothetical protein n=1 Tax=Methanosarcina sp. KYL-1 TaxID=2602068 RepID=UPI0021013F95|nr:hypothetical protein [Methanosarcina sp. KYL-1]